MGCPNNLFYWFVAGADFYDFDDDSKVQLKLIEWKEMFNAYCFFEYFFY